MFTRNMRYLFIHIPVCRLYTDDVFSRTTELPQQFEDEPTLGSGRLDSVGSPVKWKTRATIIQNNLSHFNLRNFDIFA